MMLVRPASLSDGSHLERESATSCVPPSEGKARIASECRDRSHVPSDVSLPSVVLRAVWNSLLACKALEAVFSVSIKRSGV